MTTWKKMDYNKYSLDQLEKWVSNAVDATEISPKEIYDTIYNVVSEQYDYFKRHSNRCHELMVMLNGPSEIEFDTTLDEIDSTPKVCDKDDKSPECQKAWTSFWEEYYYPEEHKEPKVEDIMPPWGHSDMEALRYTEEEMNAMCDKAASDDEKEKCREYNLREAEYYNKRAELDLNPGPHKSYIGWNTVSEYQFNEMFPNREKFKNEISRNDSNRLKYEEGWIYESPDGGKTVTKRKVGSLEKTIVKADGYSTSEKPKKWVLPVQQSVIDGTDDYYVNFPDDLLEAANLKQGDQVEWVDNHNGTWTIKKVIKTLSIDEC